MDIKASQHEGLDVITIVGSIDALTAGAATSFLTSQVQHGQIRLVLDLDQVNYVSSAGLRVVLGTLKDVRQAGGDLRLAAARPNVQKVLTMSGFTSILK